ncbi:MAG: DNA-directed RNA polymerase subunit N [Nanobdellota archaeon]
MLFPVRCFSCGKVIGQYWEEFKEKTKNRTENVKETLDDLGVNRYCCRQTFMAHVDLVENSAKFKKN